MLGKKKVRQENLFFPARRQVTGKHGLLRDMNAHIDFTPFRERAAAYFSDVGRPSIDPAVMVKMMFLGYLFGIRSDRAIVEEVIDRDSFREFIGYGPEEDIPTHANFTNWRQKLGPQVFKDFLGDIVCQCQKGGMRLGSCRLFDSTRVKARASKDSSAKVELELSEQPDEYLDAFDWQSQTDKAEDDPRYGKKLVINTNDPEARLIRHGNEPSRFVHKAHFEIDSATGLVVNTMAGHKSDHLAMVELLRQESRHVDSIGADKGYSAVECFRELEKMGIKGFIPVLDHSNDKGNKYHLADFTYREEEGAYICPGGNVLRFVCIDSKGNKRYQAKATDCSVCPLRLACISKGKRRTLTVNADRLLIEKMKFYGRLPKYARVMRKRKTLMEGTFGHAKVWCGMHRARGIGNDAMEIQAAVTAVVIDVKKLIAHLRRASSGAYWHVLRLFGRFRRLPAALQAVFRPHIAYTRSELVKVRLGANHPIILEKGTC